MGQTGYLIGIDCGTTALKAVLSDVDGHELARAQRPIPLLTPQPGWAEQNPDTVWQKLCEVLTELAPIGGAQIRALAIGAQAGSIIPVQAIATGASRPVGPMITFLDTRAAGYTEAWTQNGWGREIREITGWGLQIGQPLTSIAWLREQKPDIFEAATHFIGPHDDLVQRLTGVLAGNASCGAQMPLIDRQSGTWSAPVAERVGLRVQQLPPLAPSGSAIARILPDIADQLGLPRDLLIINGGQDHACEALALGLVDPGALMLATGTAWVITGVTDHPDIGGIPPQMDLNAHVLPQRWTISTYMGGFGAIVEWWLNAAAAAGGASVDKYAWLSQALQSAPPHLDGPLFLPESQKRPASHFHGLKLNHTWNDMTRALVEGVAFEVRHMIEALHQAHMPVTALHMLGGAAQSDVWPQLLADVTGVPIYACDNAFLGAQGASRLAAAGVGLLPSVASSLSSPVSTQSKSAQPNPELQSLYARRYAQRSELDRQKP